MKRLHLTLWVLIFGVFSINVQAQFNIPEKPNTATSVYDYTSLLSESQKSSLETKLIHYADTTSTQIVVAIIETTNRENIGLLAPRWAHEWGIGQANEDNGVFILLASKDRDIWISPGYGVEHKLTAGTLGTITRQVIIPEFKKGDYYSGLDKGTDAIINVLAGTYTAKQSNSTEFPLWILFVFIAIVICVVLLIIYAVKKGGGNHKGGRKRYSDTDILEAIILSRAGRKSRGSSWGSSGGSSWGGSSGGGFSGGFGGGGFSGGGAGGSW